jgi:oligoendopeptidase F
MIDNYDNIYINGGTNMKKWNLDALYPSFESKEFQDSLVLIEKLIEESNSYAIKELNDTSDALNKVKTFIVKSEELRSLLIKSFVFCSLSISTDAMNEEAKKYLNKMQQLSSKTTLASTKFSKWIPTISNLEELINNDELLTEVKYYINRIVEAT